MEQAVRRALIKPNTSKGKDIFLRLRVSCWGQSEREFPAMYTRAFDYTIPSRFYEAPYASSTVSMRSPAAASALLSLLWLGFRLKCRVLTSRSHHSRIAAP